MAMGRAEQSKCARVEDLERELKVWKIAQKASEEEKSALNKKVYKLERSIGSMKVRLLSSQQGPPR